MNLHALANQSSPEKSPVRLDPRLSACFKLENVCQPGNTLLWDLLQDNKIVIILFPYSFQDVKFFFFLIRVS